MLREDEVDDPNDMERAASGLIRLTCLAILAGAATGFVAAIFRIVLGLGDRWVAEAAARARDLDHGLAILMAVVAAMLGLAVWAVVRFSPETAGSGIPHVEKVIEGTAIAGGLRLLVVKFVGGALAMSGGLALGREGPSVQMGASLAHLTARTFRISWADQRILIAACAGAGLTAAFSAPIAGAVFVLEELVRRFETRLAICALMASAAAITVTGQIIGAGPELPADLVAQTASFAHPFFVLFGLVAGIFALVYNRLLIFAMDAMERIPLSPVLRAAAIGLGVGALIWSAPHIVGPGDNLVRSAMHGDEALHWLPLLLVFRLGISVLSYAVGTPGGIFAPLLMLGVE